MDRACDVLLVEDDIDVRETVADVLRDQGCRVFQAGDGEQALQILTLVVPDLIVTDLMMPRLNGWDFCAALQARERLRHIPVAVFSAFLDIQPIEGVRMIRKPLDVHALVSLLDEVANRTAP